jgi:O-antigen chain-terminating methyltransferase
MRRVIEKLAQDRQETEDLVRQKLKILHDSGGAGTAAIVELLDLQVRLMDAKDREWDALGSNHVGMIFKSMEWRVDKLAALHEDVSALMKTFILIRDKLDRLLAALESKALPTAAQIREVLTPLEETRYTGFEIRYRGDEDKIRAQQARYLPYFEPGGRVLDLGCGRGEFLALLAEKGVEAYGIEGNGQTAAVCRDKGLRCVEGDILGKMAEVGEGSLSGIFSSQVVEHLPPPYLERMLGLSYAKLKPGGTIVLETVNPTSVFALVHVYFLDLTHHKPLHPQALRYLVESAGFREIEVLLSEPIEAERLQTLPGADEKTSILNRNIDRINGLLYAPAHYAVIGRKR